MKIFSVLYDKTLAWSRHRHAERYLAAVSFAESSFFPIPPDVLLAPMTLARPERWLRLATLTTLASVAGGLFGYVIGLLAIEAVMPALHTLGYDAAFAKAQSWFEHYGFWAMLIAGFTPIPYKVFTIAAGAAGMGFLPFLAGSILGRGGRFYLVAGLIRLGGPAIEPRLRRWIDGIGWATLAILAVALVIWKL